MSNWREDDDDSRQPWSDPSGEGWKGENIPSEIPEVEEIIEETGLEEEYEACASLLSPEDFLVLQMTASDYGVYEMSKELGQEPERVAKQVTKIREFVAAWFEDDEPETIDVDELLWEIHEVGHRTRCLICENKLANDRAFCKCGGPNPNFNRNLFRILWRAEIEVIVTSECQRSHPIHRASGRTGHCEFCGKSLDTNP